MRLNKEWSRRFMQRSALGLASFFAFYCPAIAGPDKSSAPATDVYNKAVRLYEKGRWNAAKEYFHQYLAEYSDTPLYVTCLYYLAYCYQQLKDPQEAASLYHKVIDGARGGDAFWAEMAEKRLQELN
ncbi:MAG: tetratricopeptide repeat protein [Candidatus Omnitrophica bacterium]|nr:tetratricopeptide repeat protein [Candidatus Omnitrophota bacterium]